MFRRLILVLVGQVAFVLAGAAGAAEMDRDALVGNWAVTKSCGDENIEHLEFRKDASFQLTRGGKVEAMGFWEMDEGVVDIQLISSPAFFHDHFQEMEGSYFYFPVRVVLFNAESDRVEAVGLLGQQVERATLTRCK